MVSAASGRVSEDNFVVCSPQFVLAFSVCADLSHRSPSFIMTARVSLCYQSFEQDPKQSAWTEFCDVRDMDWSPITRDSHCMESLCAFIADKKYVLQDRFCHEGHLEFNVEESFLPPHLVPAQSQDVFHVTVAGTSEQFWLAFTSQGMDEEPETPLKKRQGQALPHGQQWWAEGGIFAGGHGGVAAAYHDAPPGRHGRVEFFERWPSPPSTPLCLEEEVRA